jgi:hypothetical protein
VSCKPLAAHSNHLLRVLCKHRCQLLSSVLLLLVC